MCCLHEPIQFTQICCAVHEDFVQQFCPLGSSVLTCFYAGTNIKQSSGGEQLSTPNHLVGSPTVDIINRKVVIGCSSIDSSPQMLCTLFGRPSQPPPPYPRSHPACPILLNRRRKNLRSHPQMQLTTCASGLFRGQGRYVETRTCRFFWVGDELGSSARAEGHWYGRGGRGWDGKR